MQLLAPFAGTVVSVPQGLEQPVGAGATIVVLEAMKMEHELVAERDGVVGRLEVAVGETVREGSCWPCWPSPPATRASRHRPQRRPTPASPAAAARPASPRPRRGREDLAASPPAIGWASTTARPEAVRARRERAADRPREPRRPESTPAPSSSTGR